MMRHRIPGPPRDAAAIVLHNKQVKQVHQNANMRVVEQSIADMIALEASLYRDDFAEFVRDAFRSVEPHTRFVDGKHIDAICEHLQACVEGQIKRLVINVPPGYMKLIRDSEPVFTPSGWSTHGALKVGDTVFGSDGRPTKILRVTEKAPADYRVTFTNHDTIECNGDHLWTVYDRWAHKQKTITTKQLGEEQAEQGRSRFLLPNPGRNDSGVDVDLPLHPYFLGVWLGDGNHNKPNITHSAKDTEHIEKLARLGFVGRTTHMTKTTCNTYYARQDVVSKLRALGVFENKHIPVSYMAGSFEQRCELLAGLIDTDGYVNHCEGKVKISTCDAAFATQVYKLVCSLGLRAFTVKAESPGYGEYKPGLGKEHVYQIGFSPTFALPNAIERKKSRKLLKSVRRVAIKSVSKVEAPELGHCITVENPDGLYVVGKSCVLTHNSTICSVMFPAWVWARHAKQEKDKPLQGAGARLLFTSYSDSFAERDSRKTRDLIQTEWYQRRWPLELKGDKGMEFENDKGGMRFASGISGGVTGKHFHYALTDDPLKAQDAHSRAERERVIRFWSETLSTRMFPGGVRIVVMQRLHQRDLTGYVLEEGGYEHVMLPERYESKRATVTVLGKPDKRKVDGELLWEARYGEEDNKLRTKELGPFGAAGQLQQRPAPAEGGILQRAWWKRFSWADLPVVNAFVFDVWDMTFDEGETHDYVCGIKFLGFGADLYALKRVRKQMGFMDTQNDVKTLAHDERWPAEAVLVENKANGPAIVNSLRRKVAGFQLTEPRGSKLERAHACAPIVSAGNVWLPANEAWVDDPKDGFVVECGDFPNAQNDDQVDVVTQAVQWWNEFRHAVNSDMSFDSGERTNPSRIE